MEKIVSLHDRDIYLVCASGAAPAVYFIHDKEAGGVLVNSPPFSQSLLDEIRAVGDVRFLFLPSHLGVTDIGLWQANAGLQVIAYEAEVPDIAAKIDIILDKKTRLSRTIDFLSMAGRTRGSCALRLRNLPGVVFFGPILTPGDDGWPTLIMNEDDFSAESRIFGALALKDLKYEYAFTDVFVPGLTRFGPGASEQINLRVEQAIDSI